MAANFQPHMGVNGQMMPQQQQQQQQQRQQQRGLPNNGPNQLTSQIQQMIFQNVQANTQQLSGWQAHILIQERISLIFNMLVVIMIPIHGISTDMTSLVSGIYDLRANTSRTLPHCKRWSRLVSNSRRIYLKNRWTKCAQFT